jgi:type IV secretion system protein VirD4
MSNKLFAILLLIIFTAIAFVTGLYGGGYFFLKKANIDISILSYDTLINYYDVYQHNKAIKNLLGIGFIISVVITLIPSLFGLLIFISAQNKEELHGSARWANDSELSNSGLIND